VLNSCWHFDFVDCSGWPSCSTWRPDLNIGYFTPSSKNASIYHLSWFTISNHPVPELESDRRGDCTCQSCQACTPAGLKLTSKLDPERNWISAAVAKLQIIVSCIQYSTGICRLNWNSLFPNKVKHTFDTEPKLHRFWRSLPCSLCI
jgi:hypothetical protein